MTMKPFRVIASLLAAGALLLPALAGTPEPAKPAAPAAAPAAAKDPIDINTATVDELKSIKGIGDAYAAKIVAGRPYANKSQVKSKAGIPDGVYEKIKDQIVAKQPAKAASPAAAPKK